MWNKIFNKKIFIILIIGIILIASLFFVGNKVSKNNLELADKTLQKNNIEKMDETILKTVVIKDRIVYDDNPLVLDGSSLYFDLTYSDGEIIKEDIGKLFPLTKYDARIIYPRVFSYIPKQGKVILYRGVDGTEILLDAYIFDIKTGSIKKAANQGFSLRKALADDTAYICLKADAVAMLPGWKNSKGATAERALGIALGLRILYL